MSDLGEKWYVADSPFPRQGRHHGTLAARLDEKRQRVQRAFRSQKGNFPTNARRSDRRTRKTTKKRGTANETYGRRPIAPDPAILAGISNMAHIVHDFGIVKSTVSDTITIVENVLIQDERFHLPGKKALVSETVFFEERIGRTLAVDVTAYKNRGRSNVPKKAKGMVFGQKKRHTVKTQSSSTLTHRKFSVQTKPRELCMIFNCSKRRFKRFFGGFCYWRTVLSRVIKVAQKQ